MAKRKPEAGPERIAAPLLPLAVPVDSLVEDPANARIHGERNLEAIRSSLARFGQRVPIVVQRQGMIVRAGNARLRVARELGWKTIAAVVVDEPAIDAVAYAIADNRTAELSEWDDAALARILDELRNANSETFSLEDVGYSSEKLNEMLEHLAQAIASPDDPNAEWKGMPEFEQEDQTAWKRLIVNFKNTEDLQAFAKLVEQSITERTRSIWYPTADIGHFAGKQYVDGS